MSLRREIKRNDDYIKQSFEDGARSLRIDILYVRCKGSHGYVCIRLLLNGIRDESSVHSVHLEISLRINGQSG